MVLSSYAKINLSLRINSKRKDGLHEIQSYFCLINLADKIKLKEIKEKKDKIFFKGPFSKLVNKKNNSIINLFKFLRKLKLISNYLKIKIEEIGLYNKNNNADKSMLLNGRNLTNLGVFRVYIEEYLKAHPLTNDDLTLMCRQLEPTSQGIPIQIYTFSKDKEWTKYEALTSDIFDHLLSSVKYFDLECFELNQYISN